VGFMKREMERKDAMMEVATSIAIEMEALERCEFHDEVSDLLAGMNDEVADEAVARFKAGAPEMEQFNNEEEVRKAVEDAFSNAGEECSSCAKHRDE
jgi:hypothetical protein